jgi:hypothetical protein
MWQGLVTRGRRFEGSRRGLGIVSGYGAENPIPDDFYETRSIWFPLAANGLERSPGPCRRWLPRVVLDVYIGIQACQDTMA